MKYLRLLVIAVFTVQSGYAQRAYVGFYGGVAAYSGDMTSRIYPRNGVKPAFGISGYYDATDHLTIRAGLTKAKVAGADRDSDDPSIQSRNLSFETNILETSLVGEYYLFTKGNVINPYVFGGVSVYHFNPYAYDAEGQKVYLQPLGTEGQGLSGYPDRKPYHLTQFALPFGGGIKVDITRDIGIGVELGMRKLFTEYIDDVSKTYVDWQMLYDERGPVAVDMSFRGDELNHIPTNSLISYPGAGTQRGDPTKDYFYFSGVHVTYKLGSSSSDSYGHVSRKKGKLGCPMNVY